MLRKFKPRAPGLVIALVVLAVAATSVRDSRPVPAATPYAEMQARLVRFRSHP